MGYTEQMDVCTLSRRQRLTGQRSNSYVELTVLDRSNAPTLRIRYNNAHVTDIGDIEYDIVGDETTLASSATFVYTHYTINNVITGETIEYGS